MKTIQIIISTLLLTIITSCSSVRVNSDFDSHVNFAQYKTFAFNKTSIDKVEISDLDKKRILYAIENQLKTKGLTPSETPDLLINFFTKEKEQVNINQYNYGYGFGYGWNPYLWGGPQYITTNTQGTLYIDLIDATKKELIWQGIGTGYLTQDRNKKEALINEFVAKILAQYPPIIK